MTFFGIQIEPQFGYSIRQIVSLVEHAERHGFTHAWFSDHFMLDKESVNVEAHECFAAMMIAASKTQFLRIGSLVFSNSYRHPSILAKQLVTLDHFSNGRLDVGYGAGWKELEYNAYGISFPSAGERINRLVEGIQVMKKLWTEEYATFKGKYYQLNKAIAYPKPIQEPHPPIWIGSMYGKKKMLRVIAEHGDGMNLAWSFTPEAYQERLIQLEPMMEEQGRSLKNLKKSVGLWTRIYEDEEEKQHVMEEIALKRGMSIEQVKKRYENSLHGTIPEIIQRLKEFKKIGVTHFIFMFPYNQEIEQVKVFQEEIMNKI